jgi:hypothetical protein
VPAATVALLNRFPEGELVPAGALAKVVVVGSAPEGGKSAGIFRKAG